MFFLFFEKIIDLEFKLGHHSVMFLKLELVITNFQLKLLDNFLQIVVSFCLLVDFLSELDKIFLYIIVKDFSFAFHL
jgi:hypothetical protein